MYAPTLAKSSAGYTKIGWAPGGDLTSLVQGSWQHADDFYGQLSGARGRPRRERLTPTAFRWAHASWDNAGSGLSSYDPTGWRAGDGSSAVVRQERVAREDRKRSLGRYCPLQIGFVLPPVPYAAKSSGCSEISGTAQFADHHTLRD